jgi:hypothetical protein
MCLRWQGFIKLNHFASTQQIVSRPEGICRFIGLLGKCIIIKPILIAFNKANLNLPDINHYNLTITLTTSAEEPT